MNFAPRFCSTKPHPLGIMHEPKPLPAGSSGVLKPPKLLLMKDMALPAESVMAK